MSDNINCETLQDLGRYVREKGAPAPELQEEFKNVFTDKTMHLMEFTDLTPGYPVVVDPKYFDPGNKWNETGSTWDLNGTYKPCLIVDNQSMCFYPQAIGLKGKAKKRKVPKLGNKNNETDPVPIPIFSIVPFENSKSNELEKDGNLIQMLVKLNVSLARVKKEMRVGFYLPDRNILFSQNVDLKFDSDGRRKNKGEIQKRKIEEKQKKPKKQKKSKKQKTDATPNSQGGNETPAPPSSNKTNSIPQEQQQEGEQEVDQQEEQEKEQEAPSSNTTHTSISTDPYSSSNETILILQQQEEQEKSKDNVDNTGTNFEEMLPQGNPFSSHISPYTHPHSPDLTLNVPQEVPPNDEEPTPGNATLQTILDSLMNEL